VFCFVDESLQGVFYVVVYKDFHLSTDLYKVFKRMTFSQFHNNPWLSAVLAVLLRCAAMHCVALSTAEASLSM
jgi:hypothetical protein